MAGGIWESEPSSHADFDAACFLQLAWREPGTDRSDASRLARCNYAAPSIATTNVYVAAGDTFGNPAQLNMAVVPHYQRRYRGSLWLSGSIWRDICYLEPGSETETS